MLERLSAFVTLVADEHPENQALAAEANATNTQGLLALTDDAMDALANEPVDQ